jgi:hypothetical protein
MYVVGQSVWTDNMAGLIQGRTRSPLWSLDFLLRDSRELVEQTEGMVKMYACN